MDIVRNSAKQLQKTAPMKGGFLSLVRRSCEGYVVVFCIVFLCIDHWTMSSGMHALRARLRYYSCAKNIRCFGMWRGQSFSGVVSVLEHMVKWPLSPYWYKHIIRSICSVETLAALSSLTLCRYSRWRFAGSIWQIWAYFGGANIQSARICICSFWQERRGM